MNLPDKIGIYLLQDPVTKEIVYASHDARLAVLVKESNREGGRLLDIVPVVSTRRPQATGLTEHRCFACPTPHTVSWEASSDWTSRMLETACESALLRAKHLDGRFN